MSLNVLGQRVQRTGIISIIAHEAHHCAVITRPLLNPDTQLHDILTAVYHHLHTLGCSLPWHITNACIYSFMETVVTNTQWSCRRETETNLPLNRGWLGQCGSLEAQSQHSQHPTPLQTGTGSTNAEDNGISALMGAYHGGPPPAAGTPQELFYDRVKGQSVLPQCRMSKPQKEHAGQLGMTSNKQWWFMSCNSSQGWSQCIYMIVWETLKNRHNEPYLQTGL